MTHTTYFDENIIRVFYHLSGQIIDDSYICKNSLYFFNCTLNVTMAMVEFLRGSFIYKQL